ncbi:peptidoglycan editing factor PgeF, partial [Streptomyces boncukensis]|nr:peptidoglycan editing factor PgeF [Streptomyces boncukensis]
MIGRHETVSGAHFAFTDRWGGVSAAPYEQLNLGDRVGDEAEAVRSNRALAAASLGLDPADVVWMRQVHGRDVAAVVKPFDGGAGEPPALDGVVTARRGLALAVQTADCTPVLLADPAAGVAGAAHAGRPGLFTGVVGSVVEAMAELGARPERIVARIGPTVCGGCYEVPEALRAEVAAAVPEAYATTRWGTPALDLTAGVRAQLARHSVPAPEGPAVCTRESADHFSYRREGTTGRLAGYVWLGENGTDGADGENGEN